MTIAQVHILCYFPHLLDWYFIHISKLHLRYSTRFHTEKHYLLFLAKFLMKSKKFLNPTKTLNLAAFTLRTNLQGFSWWARCFRKNWVDLHHTFPKNKTFFIIWFIILQQLPLLSFILRLEILPPQVQPLPIYSALTVRGQENVDIFYKYIIRWKKNSLGNRLPVSLLNIKQI